MRILLFVILAFQLACSAASQQTQKVRRHPLPKSDFVLKSPTQHLKEEEVDPKTGKVITYDPRPQIVLVDPKAGKYHFKWIGYDGKEKIIEYQRADAIDLIVSASVSENLEGQYVYTYNFQNLPSSATHLSYFFVQNFAANVKQINPGRGYVGKVSNLSSYFQEGNWLGFGSTYFNNEVTPGREGKAQLLSPALPGLVECRIAGGDLTLKGVGEDMPPELERALGGYAEWPKGYTIGPVDKLKNLSLEERAKYFLDLLPKFQELGWLTDEARRNYEPLLKRNDLVGALQQAEQDLKVERITSEVYAIIEGLNQK